MPEFGLTSRKRLASCHPYIRLVMNTVIKTFDITILKDGGWRGELRQNELYANGDSGTPWPDSKHNYMLGGIPYSLAVDAAPWPIDWDDWERFQHMAGRILQTADIYGFKLEWGGFWKSLKDGPHFQLVL